MPILTKIEKYRDDNNNIIESETTHHSGIRINFIGSNNRLIVHKDTKIDQLSIEFSCDNGFFEIGRHGKVRHFIGSVRIGQDSKIILGDNVSTTGKCLITAAEGSSVIIGDDVMIASQVEIRGDDAHPIFDIQTEKRINLSRGVNIGSHVWLAQRTAILNGSNIGNGCVVGFGSVVKGDFPNNCIISGVPARITKRNIAWERPHLCGRPYYKPDASTVRKSIYWDVTIEDEASPNIVLKKPDAISRIVERMRRMVLKKSG